MAKKTPPQKTCPECKTKNHARKKKCSNEGCDHEFVTAAKPATAVSKATPLTKEQIQLVLDGIELVDAAREQGVTVEDYVNSIELKWEALDGITNIKQLNDLKARAAHSKLVNDLGGAKAAIKTLNIIREARS